MLENLSEREKQILTLLVDEQGISVSEMGVRLGVSAVTVRTGLNALAEKGVIVRTRGGATPAFHAEILERQRARTTAKARIAQAAAGLVSDGDTVMIEAGSTTAMVGRYLFGKQDVHVVTNNMLFLPYGRSNPALQVTVVGGRFQPGTESTVGPIALRELSALHVDLAFVGTDGFSVANGTTTHHVEGAEIVRTMSARARRTVLLADSSKYGRVGFTHVLGLEEVSLIITDSEITPDAREEISSRGIEIQVVE